MTDNRRAVRVVPRRAITVAVADGGLGHETGLTRAYGVVANISETGACLLTNGVFGVGERLSLQLSFAREPVPFETTGQVVWTGATADRGVLRYGLQFGETPTRTKDQLRSLIASSAA
jgi:hypothetical protein